jgi:hypothetical protein
MRQSLFWKVRNGVNYSHELGNSIWGYYADGFFDRRKLENASSSVVNSTVLPSTKDIAHIGRLFFNPLSGSKRYSASLFFPAAGWVNENGGNLVNIGYDCAYWSSTASHNLSNYYGLCIVLRNIQASMWFSSKAEAAAVRPVVE